MSKNKKQLADPAPALAADILTAAVNECKAAGLFVGAGWSPALDDRPAGVIVFCGGLLLDGDGRFIVDAGADDGNK
jgi:hypothetical protein